MTSFARFRPAVRDPCTTCGCEPSCSRMKRSGNRPGPRSDRDWPEAAHVSSAHAGLRFARGVMRPICLCWRSSIGAECGVRIGENRHLPQPHGAVRVGGGQEPAVRAERHAGHAPPRAGTGREGPADGPPGGQIPQPHIPGRAGGSQQIAVRLNATPYTPPFAFGSVSAASGEPAACPVTGSHIRT